jgi:hypothetical protein
MKRTIEVTVDPVGGIKIDAINFAGADCEKATKYLEEALGVVSEKQKKPEYYQQHRQKHQQRVGQ